jgi:predicted transcriptional regulator
VAVFAALCESSGMRRGFDIASPLRVIQMRSKSHFIGDGECEVLERVWSLDLPTVYDVISSLDRPLAYTTVMTTLNRLVEKGVLARLKRGKKFVYRPTLSRWEFQIELAKSLAHRLSSDEMCSIAEILSILIGDIVPQDIELLDRLEASIQEKRKLGCRLLRSA